MASQPQTAAWLLEHGPKELELLFRAVVFQPSTPILIADNNRQYCEASVGAGKLLGLPREKIIGRSLDDFAKPSFKPVLSDLWRAFLDEGEQEGALQLVVGPDRDAREVEYLAKGNVLPVRHVLVLRDKTAPADVPAWVQDYALYLLDAEGCVAAWYEGAERIYGYKRAEVIGQHVSMFYPGDDARRALEEKLKRAAAEGHAGAECWHLKKDGSRFWANVITMALKDDDGNLQGFARVARDFSARHERDERLRRSRARQQPLPKTFSIAGIVSGEFDRVPEANDAFLELVGYSREDL